uniref:Zinc phosphodiesterase ELAC protein 2 n=1 Tax=Cyprinus carpio TaxID=7962 RepID=A0A8C1LJF1_CYPCA
VGSASIINTRESSTLLLRLMETHCSRKIRPVRDTLRRVKVKENRRQGELNGPSSVYVQVVGAGSRDSGASLYVFSEYNRYLFNCGEGTQRLMQEHKMKIARLDNIFLTRMSWETVGGLSGMILTLKDTGVPQCVLSGPPQLEKYLQAIRVFSGQLEDIKLAVRPYTEPQYKDDTMTVSQVPLFSEAGRCSPGSGRSSSQKGALRRQDVLEESQSLSASPEGKEKVTRDSSLVVAYVCKLHSKKGNFLVLKAKEMGLPLSLFFIVVDCPSEDFIQPLCTNHILQRHQTGGSEDSAALVVHMTPESVLDTDQYKSWMERFPSSTEHLVMNEQTFTPHNTRSHKLQTQLNLIHPEIFPPLKLYKTKEPRASLRTPNIRAECLMKFQLRPKLEWQRDAIPSCDSEEFVKEAAEVPNFFEEVEECRKFQTAESISTSGEKFPEIVFLGTGSSLPMKIRNVSGTLVNIRMLFIALLTFLSVLSSAQGLIHLLLERERALNSLGKAFSPVYLIAPVQIMTWLNQYHDHCQQILSQINIIPSKFLCDGAEIPTVETKSFIQAVLKKNDLLKFQTCYVRHCKNAFACSLTHQSGWQLVFSGDTMPCDAVVNIGKNATLLIHEATLEDGMEEEACEKRHSTTSQAIGIGMKMNAEFIVLNHFSQRYAKIPLFSDDFNSKVGISFDHMRIRFGDFPMLPRLIRPLKALFAEEIEEMEERRERREMKKTAEPPSNGESGTSRQPEETNRVTKREQDDLNREAAIKRLKTN